MREDVDSLRIFQRLLEKEISQKTASAVKWTSNIKADGEESPVS